MSPTSILFVFFMTKQKISKLESVFSRWPKINSIHPIGDMRLYLKFEVVKRF